MTAKTRFHAVMAAAVIAACGVAHPARATDLGKVPLADGSTVDFHRYPVGSRHEDFAMLIEAPGSRLGWTAAVRPDSR